MQTRLAMLRWMNISPGSRPVTASAGMRESEQPVYMRVSDCHYRPHSFVLIGHLGLHISTSFLSSIRKNKKYSWISMNLENAYQSKDNLGSVPASTSQRTRDVSPFAQPPTSYYSQRSYHGSAAGTFLPPWGWMGARRQTLRCKVSRKLTRDGFVVFATMKGGRCKVLRKLLDELKISRGETGCDVMLLIMSMPSVTVFV